MAEKTSWRSQFRRTSIQLVDVTDGAQLHVKKLTVHEDPKMVLQAIRELIESRGWATSRRLATTPDGDEPAA